MDQYPVSTCQRATSVAIAWMPATRSSLIVLLTCYLLIIVVLPNHLMSSSTFFLSNRLLWAKLCILLINWMVNCSLYQMRVTIDHNLMIFSRNTELITWHGICQFFSRVVLMTAVSFVTKLRIPWQLVQCIWHSYYEFFLYMLCAILSNKHFLKFKFQVHTPYLALTGDIWRIFCDDCGENKPP